MTPQVEARTPWNLLDGLKAGASVLIVLHHLAFYGPMTDVARPLAPDFIDFLADPARMAVQVFLVVGGYLAARGVLQLWGELTVGTVGRKLAQRFMRLALPFWVAMVMAVLGNALADRWMDHPAIAAPPTVWQLLAHALLLHDLMEVEALSAGVWYVAIDFQLYSGLLLFAALVSRIHHHRAGLWWTTLGLMAVSLWYFNRHSHFDALSVYFWGSYGMGVMVALCAGPHRVMSPWWAKGGLAVVVIALWIDFRWRPVVALATALLLWLWVQARPRWTGQPAWLGFLSRISYALFLVHFPVCLVITALWTQWVPPHPVWHLMGVVLAFKLSVLTAWAFHHGVELPSLRWIDRRLAPKP